MKKELTTEEFNFAAMTADPSPEKALYWLSYYADECGDAFGRMKFLELNRKTVRGRLYHTYANGSNTDKMQRAEADPEYVEACQKFANAAADHMRLSVLKEAAVLKITVWQSKAKLANRGHPS